MAVGHKFKVQSEKLKVDGGNEMETEEETTLLVPQEKAVEGTEVE